MKKTCSVLLALVCVLGVFAPAFADSLFLSFKGGIGVIPVSRVAGDQNPVDGTFPNVVRNDVRGTPPGGQPWVIADLKADIHQDGRIRVDGRGLLLAGGNNIGFNGGQSVRAVLFCGTAAHQTNLVPLEANGDFVIDDDLTPAPSDPCTNPVLLIVSGGGAWFAAGIPAN